MTAETVKLKGDGELYTRLITPEPTVQYHLSITKKIRHCTPYKNLYLKEKRKSDLILIKPLAEFSIFRKYRGYKNIKPSRQRNQQNPVCGKTFPDRCFSFSTNKWQEEKKTEASDE